MPSAVVVGWRNIFMSGFQHLAYCRHWPLHLPQFGLCV